MKLSFRPNYRRARALALDGDDAWFAPDAGCRVTLNASDLRNIPEDGQ